MFCVDYQQVHCINRKGGVVLNVVLTTCFCCITAGFMQIQQQRWKYLITSTQINVIKSPSWILVLLHFFRSASVLILKYALLKS